MEHIHSQDTPILAIIRELVGPSYEGVSPQGPPLPVDDYGRFRLPTTRDAPTAIERHLYVPLLCFSFSMLTFLFIIPLMFTL